MKALDPAHLIPRTPGRARGWMQWAGFASLKIEERFHGGTATFSGPAARGLRATDPAPFARHPRRAPGTA